MFTTKQSDIFYNDQTKELFVCKVSAISARRCEGSDDIVYGALPIIHKIDKDTNYQTTVYPKNLNTFKTDVNSDLYDLLPMNCYTDSLSFSSITKPLFNYNKTSDRYSITLAGKYANRTQGFGILSYIFQPIDTNFHLLDAQVYVPKDKSTKTPLFSFANGYLNSDFIIGGNRMRWNEPIDTSYSERIADYNIKPMHLQDKIGSDASERLGFNLLNYCPGYLETHCLTAGTQYPMLYSGSYITYNPKYTAFDSNYDIRVDFRARSYNVPSMSALASEQSSNDSATPSRWSRIADTTDNPGGLSGAGHGFCVYFYKNPDQGIVEPNGIGSTLGYAIAGNVGTEQNGELASVEGLVVNAGGNIGTDNGPAAESFLGVGFDIKGDFCTTSETKEGWLSADDAFRAPTTSTWTTAPCSIGVRGSRSNFTRVLTCVPMNTVATSGTVHMHENKAEEKVAFQDYRIDLTNKGSRLTVYHKLTSATDYSTIFQLELDEKFGTANPIQYDPWLLTEGNVGGPRSAGVGSGEPYPLNVGLTFTTNEYTSHFELSSFEVTGVKIGKPNVEPELIDNSTTVEYLEESSANLRKDLVSITNNEVVDIEMSIKRERLLERINICEPENTIVKNEIKTKWTGVKLDKKVDIPGPPSDPIPDDPVETTTPTKEIPCEPGWFAPVFTTQKSTETEPYIRDNTSARLDTREVTVISNKITGWTRISSSQISTSFSGTQYQELTDTTIGNTIIVQYETGGGTDLRAGEGMFRESPGVEGDWSGWGAMLDQYEYPLEGSKYPATRIGQTKYLKVAIYFTKEEVKARGLCTSEEKELDFVDPDPDPPSQIKFGCWYFWDAQYSGWLEQAHAWVMTGFNHDGTNHFVLFPWHYFNYRLAMHRDISKGRMLENFHAPVLAWDGEHAGKSKKSAKTYEPANKLVRLNNDLDIWGNPKDNFNLLTSRMGLEADEIHQWSAGKMEFVHDMGLAYHNRYSSFYYSFGEGGVSGEVRDQLNGTLKEDPTDSLAGYMTKKINDGTLHFTHDKSNFYICHNVDIGTEIEKNRRLPDFKTGKNLKVKHHGAINLKNEAEFFEFWQKNFKYTYDKEKFNIIENWETIGKPSTLEKVSSSDRNKQYYKNFGWTPSMLNKLDFTAGDCGMNSINGNVGSGAIEEAKMLFSTLDNEQEPPKPNTTTTSVTPRKDPSPLPTSDVIPIATNPNLKVPPPPPTPPAGGGNTKEPIGIESKER